MAPYIGKDGIMWKCNGKHKIEPVPHIYIMPSLWFLKSQPIPKPIPKPPIFINYVKPISRTVIKKENQLF